MIGDDPTEAGAASPRERSGVREVTGSSSPFLEPLFWSGARSGERLFRYPLPLPFPPRRPRVPLYRDGFRLRLHPSIKFARGYRRLRRLKETTTI